MKKRSGATFALLILVAVPGINYLLLDKLVVFSFFFIALLLGAYYLERRLAILGGVLMTLLVAIAIYHFPGSILPSLTQTSLDVVLLAWASFVILAVGMIGSLTQRLKAEVQQVIDIKADLEDHTVKLDLLVTELITK
ncbi:MAG: hypothetical protein V3R94_10980 [Acidobacteriota bacterium]